MLTFPQHLIRSVAFPSFWILYLLRPWPKYLWGQQPSPILFFFSIFWDNTAKSLLFYCLYSFAGEIWSSEENFTKTRVLPRKVQQSQSDNSCTQIGGTLLSSPTYYTLCKPSPAGQLLGTRPSSKWLACIIVLFTIYNHFGGVGTVIL